VDFLGQLSGYDPLRSLGGISQALGKLVGQTQAEGAIDNILGNRTGKLLGAEQGQMMRSMGAPAPSPSQQSASPGAVSAPSPQNVQALLELKRRQLNELIRRGFADNPRTKALQNEVSYLEKEASLERAEAKESSKELAKNVAAPPEIQDKIDSLINKKEWKSMSPEERYAAALKEGIPSGYIDSLLKASEQGTAHDEGK